MKKEISKKLLSEVLEINEKLISDVSIDEFECRYYDVEDDKYYSCNIYELAHKCKIWAHSNGYMLNTVILTADNKTWYCEDDYKKTRTTWKENSESLVIFKACEWIMNKLQESK